MSLTAASSGSFFALTSSSIASIASSKRRSSAAWSARFLASRPARASSAARSRASCSLVTSVRKTLWWRERRRTLSLTLHATHGSWRARKFSNSSRESGWRPGVLARCRSRGPISPALLRCDDEIRNAKRARRGRRCIRRAALCMAAAAAAPAAKLHALAPDTPFQALLIDRQQFEVDIELWRALVLVHRTDGGRRADRCSQPTRRFRRLGGAQPRAHDRARARALPDARPSTRRPLSRAKLATFLTSGRAR